MPFRQEQPSMHDTGQNDLDFLQDDPHVSGQTDVHDLYSEQLSSPCGHCMATINATI